MWCGVVWCGVVWCGLHPVSLLFRYEMLEDAKLVSNLPDNGQKIRDKLKIFEVDAFEGAQKCYLL